MESETTIVFLHGAGTGAWVWERVVKALSTPAVALDIPAEIDGATPENCARMLVAELDQKSIGSVVLVLHSLAGVLVSGLAERLGARLKQCVFVAAVIPPSGGSFVDALGFVDRLILRVLFKLNPRGLKPSAAMIRRQLCNDLGLQDADSVVSRYTAQMPGLYLTPIGALPSISCCVYIKLMKDRSIAPMVQDSMIARLDSPVVKELEAGHLAMLSAPDALARLLEEAAEPVSESISEAAR